MRRGTRRRQIVPMTPLSHLASVMGIMVMGFSTKRYKVFWEGKKGREGKETNHNFKIPPTTLPTPLDPQKYTPKLGLGDFDDPSADRTGVGHRMTLGNSVFNDIQLDIGEAHARRVYVGNSPTDSKAKHDAEEEGGRKGGKNAKQEPAEKTAEAENRPKTVEIRERSDTERS